MRSPTELGQVFRHSQMKLTPQRRLLFGLLHDNQTHPTAESLYEVASKRMPGISLRTVYQTLGELAEMGELQLIDIGVGATRFDPNMGDHHHFVCGSCGAIRDVAITATPRLEASSVDGCEVDNVGVVFRGRCSRCRARSAHPARETLRKETRNKRSPGQQAKVSMKK